MSTTVRHMSEQTLISDFLAAPPEGTPEAVLDLLRAGLREQRGGGVPMRIFYEAVEQSPIATSITDTAANILYANRAFSRVTGYSMRDVIGRNASMLSDKNTPPEVYRDLWSTVSKRQIWRGQLVNRRALGERYLAELTIAPVFSGGEVSHYLAMHRDITQEHETQQGLKNQKRVVESVLDMTPTAIALLAPDGRVILDNHAYKKLVGDMQVAEPAFTFIDQLHAALGPRFDECKQRGGTFQNIEVLISPKGGRRERWFSCFGNWFDMEETGVENYFEGHESRYLLLAINEITHHKLQQEELRAAAIHSLTLQQELTQSLREVISAAIFQFQTPLNLIGAATGIVQRRATSEGGTEQEPMMRVLGLALREGRKVIDTLRSSLPERIDEGRGAVNINQVVRDTLAIITPQLLKQGVVVDWLPTAHLPNLCAVESQLRTAVKKVLENAVEALSQKRDGERSLRIKTNQVGGVVELSIMDNGPGIPLDLRLRAFEPFFTTKAGGGGLGMGLTIAQEIVNDHQGTIVLGEGEQGGCRVTLRLPLKSTHGECK